MTSPLPDHIKVQLPVGQIATAHDNRHGDFQPAMVAWTAFTTPTRRVIVSATAHGPDRHCTLDVEAEPWCPTAPEWFTAEVARMQAAADYDRREDRRADMQADVAAGLA